MSLPAPTVKVFIAGASYAGLSAALNLLDLGSGLNPRLTKGAPYAHHHDLPRVNFQITLVDERDGFLHLIGCPLALADAEYSKKCWVKFNDIPSLQHPNVTVLQGTVTSVSPATKTATITSPVTGETTSHTYDYLVAATGLRRAWPVVPQSLHRKQYLLEAEEHIHAVLNARHPVLVVGGGAVGIEMASEIRVVKPGARVTLAHSRDQLLSAENLPDDTKDRALECLRGEGVDVLMNHRLAKSEKRVVDDGTTEYDVEFTNGHKMVASVVIMAISHSTPTVSYLPKEAVNSEGFVDVRPSLHFPAKDIPNADDHFCGGDAIQWSGIKRCGGAMWHGYCIAHNIHQQLLEKHCGQQPKFMEIAPIGPVIGLAVGNNAVAHNPGQGTTYGPDVRQVYFRDDLAFDSESISNAGRNARADNTNDKTVIWNYMKLGKAEMAPAA